MQIDVLQTLVEQQVLMLHFSPKNPEDYLNEDIMSFLVTQVQKIFPEYLCIGKLV